MKIKTISQKRWLRKVAEVLPTIGRLYILDGKFGPAVYRTLKVEPEIVLVIKQHTVNRDLHFEPSHDPQWLSKKSRFLSALRKVELEATDVGKYRGSIECPHCSKFISARNIEVDDWIWPEYYSHLIEKHGLQPTKRFQNFVSTKGETQ